MNEESKQIIAEMKEIGKMLNDKIEQVRTELKGEIQQVRTELKGEIQQVRQRVDNVEEKLNVVAEDVEYIKLKTYIIASTVKLHDTEINRLKFDISRFKKAE